MKNKIASLAVLLALSTSVVACNTNEPETPATTTPTEEVPVDQTAPEATPTTPATTPEATPTTPATTP
ncbi:MAG TPA: hypothetical protein V6D27_06815, partial [Vampirovibrionales bacterium]